MSNLKILHLATDDKFIDQAILLFDKTFPGSNEIYIFSRTEKLRYVKRPVDKVIKPNRLFKKPTLSYLDYAGYNLVVFHSLSDALYPEIFAIPTNIPIIWLGWGYDYYGLITSAESLLLEKTLKLTERLERHTYRSFIASKMKTLFKKVKVSRTKTGAIEKITLFSPVLPQEYDLIKNSRMWSQFPEHSQWNYGTIEDNFVKGFEDAQVESDSILLGNSASSTSNHIEALYFLKSLGVKQRKIVTPLSYGNRIYANEIQRVGYDLFPEDFLSLVEFMPIDDYVKTIKQCGYVIMNHKRQQAVGNIVIMLYLGAHVFLREENPTYNFFKKMGVFLSSVQELERDSSLLSKPLSTEAKDTNRRLVSDYWSRERGITRTKNLVKKAIEAKEHNV